MKLLLITLLIIGSYSLSALAADPWPQIEHERPVLVFKDHVPIALIGMDFIAQADSGCSNNLGTFIVDEVAYEGVSELVAGIRVKRLIRHWYGDTIEDGPSVLMRLEGSEMSAADNSWVSSLVPEGAKLLIAYNICGSGGFHSARDIYRIRDGSAEFYMN